jgi:hypothetical protein
MASHKSDPRSSTVVAEPQRPVFDESPRPAVTVTERGMQRGAGVRDVVSGLVLIGIGLLYGGSVFTGTANALDWAFDILGTAWVARGVYRLAAR